MQELNLDAILNSVREHKSSQRDVETVLPSSLNPTTTMIFFPGDIDSDVVLDYRKKVKAKLSKIKGIETSVKLHERHSWIEVEHRTARGHMWRDSATKEVLTAIQTAFN